MCGSLFITHRRTYADGKSKEVREEAAKKPSGRLPEGPQSIRACCPSPLWSPTWQARRRGCEGRARVLAHSKHDSLAIGKKGARVSCCGLLKSVTNVPQAEAQGRQPFTGEEMIFKGSRDVKVKVRR